MTQTSQARVALLHGALCDAGIWVDTLEDFRARGIDAFALELSGFYPSQFDPSRFSADRHVQEVIDTLSAESGPVHLIGHSRGGRMALDIAARAPELLASLILVEPGGVREPDFFPPDIPPSPSLEGPMQAALAQLAAGDPEQAMKSYFEISQGAGTWDSLPSIVRVCAVRNAETVRGMKPDTTCPLSRSVARQVRTPTLLLEGAESPELFHHIGDVLESCIPQTRRVRVSGSEHFLPFTHRDEFLSLVAESLGLTNPR